MRVRLFAVMTALMMLVAALPFTASAAAPNVGRIGSTSWVDMAGNETNPLCDVVSQVPGTYQVGITYSGTGALLGGTGSGTLTVNVFGSSMGFFGEIEIDGQPAFIEGGASLMCIGSSYAILIGGFFAEGGSGIPNGIGSQALEPGEVVCGDLIGNISDGVHKNQGRLSLTLSADAEGCPV